MTSFYLEYQKIYVSVDCIIFGFDEGKLKILIGKRKMDPGRDEWSLYGGFVHIDESIDDAANRTLFELTGMRNIYMRQVGAFGDIDRDPGERVISIAFFTLARTCPVSGADDAARAQWFPIDRVPQLAFDHRLIFEQALERMSHYLKLKTGNFLSDDFNYDEIDMIYYATLTR